MVDPTHPMVSRITWEAVDWRSCTVDNVNGNLVAQMCASSSTSRIFTIYHGQEIQLLQKLTKWYPCYGWKTTWYAFV